MLVGIDEVGRGSLAGPLVIGVVGLNEPIIGLKDSKLLSLKQRTRLAQAIYNNSLATALGWVWPHEIDTLGLTAATTLAIKRGLGQINGQIDEIIIDGNYNYLSGVTTARALIKADNLVPAVSAASIIAKVARDNYMQFMDQYFKPYGFIKNVGYGTKSHLLAIKDSGPCVLHRRSYAPVNLTG